MDSKTYVYRVSEPGVYRIVSREDGHKSVDVTAVGLLEIASWVDGHRVELQYEAAEELAHDVAYTEQQRTRAQASQDEWAKYKDVLGKDIDP